MTQPMSPFQIRLELLMMAKDLLMQDYETKKHALEQQWQTKVESAKIAGTPSPDFPALPYFPNEDEIVKKAEALNLFVSQTQTPEIKITKKSHS